ncbi:DNA primase [Streptomyces sp. NPDC003631]|uniref:DNA primase n=1 Tax=Streptomyces lannensis TaxID=766498 RepID=A0ABP7LVN3_9ACTN|nr:DNA primase [Streptomyces sp. WAC07094]
MNGLVLGLAVGAGYVLGRTKKMKLACAVGSLVAGKRMHLSPKGVTDLISEQLHNNPQFKEIGDQLRQDLRGVGKAASGPLVERQLEGLAKRLHGRTDRAREQLSGRVPATSDLSGLHDEEEEAGEEEGAGEASQGEKAPREAQAKAPAKKTSATARKAPAKKGPAKKAPARKATTTKGGARRATSGSAGERGR